MGKGMSTKRKEMGEAAWAEYQRLRKNEKAVRWKARNVNKVIDWRRRTKLKLIDWKGGKCEICGYDKRIPGVFVFHHRDPSQKEFGVSGKTKSIEKLKKEVEKCQLLCANCHAEVHDAEYLQKRQKSEEQYQIWMEKAEKIQTDMSKVKVDPAFRADSVQHKPKPKCKVCGESVKMYTREYCSRECYQLDHRKVERPSRQELADLIGKESWSALGRKYNVSDNAVRKWARSYELI